MGSFSSAQSHANYEVIAVSGYGWSGSGAVVDLLCEVDGCCTPNLEFSLIKEPGGLVDLEHFLVDQWDLISSSVAIERFVQLVGVQSRPFQRFGHWGGGYNAKLGIQLESLTQDFLRLLNVLEYKGATRVHQYQYGHLASFLRKICRAAGFGGFRHKDMFISNPSGLEFLKAVNIFLQSIMTPLIASFGASHLILDQAISATNPSKALRYFPKIKLVIVDRDPRDIYVDQINNKSLMGTNKSDPNRVGKFIKSYLASRQCSAPLDSFSATIMRVQFEDLVINYDDETNKILEFCGLSPAIWKPRTRFNPDRSEVNVGLWKKFKNQQDIRLLELGLSDFCLVDSRGCWSFLTPNSDGLL